MTKFRFLAIVTACACSTSHPATNDAGGDAQPGGDAGIPTASLFVATDGNDTWSGTLPTPNSAGTDGPLLTLDGARRAAAPWKTAHSGDVTVMFRGGNYFLTAAVAFSASDSGSTDQQIIYTNYPGETPVISGGALVTGWTQSAGNTWTTPIDPAAYQYFEQLYVNGTRRLRPTTTPTGYLYNAGPVLVDTKTAACSVASGAQWECFDRFQFTGTDMSPSWRNLTDIVVDDFENWTVAKLHVASVDAAAHIAYLTGTTTQSATFGFLLGHRYLVENVPDALNQPGEFYLDRSVTPWLLTYLPTSADGSPATSEVIAPQLEQLVTAQDLAYVTFRGLTFAHTSWTVPATGHRGSQAEPLVSAALSFDAASNVTIDGCIIAHTGGWGVELETTSAGNAVINSELTDLGAGGVRIGQVDHAGDSDATVPHDNLVQNTIVTGTGRVNPDGGGVAIWLGAAYHNTVTHNEIADSYGGGIGVNVPVGSGAIPSHDNTVSFNLVHNINEGTMRDGGAIYLAVGNATGNQVLNNVVHDVSSDTTAGSYGGWGIYLDNGSSNILVSNNLVYRVGAAPGYNHDGVANLWDNNIFAYGRTSQIQNGSSYTAAALTFTFSHNIVFFDKGLLQARNPWDCFGGPCTAVFDFSHNLYSEVGGTPTFDTTDVSGGTKVTYTLAQWQAIGEDVGSAIADPCFTAATYPTDDYSLCTASPAFTVGFVAFDPTQAGRTAPLLVPPPVPAGFPLQLLDPATDY